MILVSVHTSVQKITAARDAGANMVVRKPIAPAVVLDRIEWLARNTRPFVASDVYCGPDRRFRNAPRPEGAEERRAEAMALAACPEREMSQSDIDSLFG